jgi:hypothetical protein
MLMLSPMSSTFFSDVENLAGGRPVKCCSGGEHGSTAAGPNAASSSSSSSSAIGLAIAWQTQV